MIFGQGQPQDAVFLKALREGRGRTLELIEDLTDEQMIGPRLEIVNPLRWEIGHVGWFQEYWIVRHSRKEAPTWADGDRLYDSARIAHDTRWDLPLPSKMDTVAYIQRILERVEEPHSSKGSDTAGEPGDYQESYFLWLALLHEYMHAEAITYTRQTLGYSEPRIGISKSSAGRCGRGDLLVSNRRLSGDAEIPGGTFLLGSPPDRSFVFDNELDAHPVSVSPFRMARTAVTNGDFAAFVEEQGYLKREFWSEAGWQWRVRSGLAHPIYWRKQEGGRWLRRNFDIWVPLEERLPVLHVNWYEADAYCRWAGRRLPTEAEWEMAASIEPGSDSHGTEVRRRMFPWGDEPPTPNRANLDSSMGCLEVDSLPEGDSAFGCRQMMGNVWEWTSTDFGPYPGFRPGPYKEYSAPWFGNHKVLRGGCWATRSGLIRNTYRNFYQPHRSDVWAGFRTCAL